MSLGLLQPVVQPPLHISFDILQVILRYLTAEIRIRALHDCDVKPEAVLHLISWRVVCRVEGTVQPLLGFLYVSRVVAGELSNCGRELFLQLPHLVGVVQVGLGGQ